MTKWKIALIATMVSSVAYADDQTEKLKEFAGNYVCVEEASAGARYDNDVKRWVSATFRPSAAKVLVKISPINFVKSNEYSEDLDMLADVKISEFGGSKYEDICRGMRGASIINKYGTLICFGAIEEYRFNFDTGRYLRIYPVGYIYDKKNENSDTPAISIGTCAKL